MSGVRNRINELGVEDVRLVSVVGLVVFQEDALAGTVERGGDHPIDEALRNGDHAHPASGVVARRAGDIAHVREPVLEEHEHVGTVIGAQAITGTEILVDPHAHSVTAGESVRA